MTTKRQEEDGWATVRKSPYSKAFADKAAKKLREVQAKYGAKAIADAKRMLRKEGQVAHYAPRSKKSAAKKGMPREARVPLEVLSAVRAKQEADLWSRWGKRIASPSDVVMEGKFGISRATGARKPASKMAASSSDVVVKGVHVTVVKKGARKPSSDCKKLKVTATKSVLVCPVFDGS